MAYINGKKTLTKVIKSGSIDGVQKTSDTSIAIMKEFRDIEIYGKQQITLYGIDTPVEIYNSQGDLLCVVENDAIK